MRRTFLVTAVLLAVTIGVAFAQTGSNLVGANLQGKNLQNADLHNANLQNADLQGANLRGANLTGANLRGANLLGVHLTGANLTGAVLQMANLQHADSEGANFQNANLQQANLQGADLQNAVLTGADLYGANLTRANLFGANLQAANLQTANLHGANLHNASLNNASLQRADLQGTNLIGANLLGAKLQGANLHGSRRSASSALAVATPPAASGPLPPPPTTPPRIYPTGRPRGYYPPPARIYETPPPAVFGNAPMGEVPILFNDHTVHTTDVLSRDRVLAALVRGEAILVPLRAMLNQMGGAQVSYDAGSRTIDIMKPGAHVVLTLGVPRVIVNGKVHPLDVAPMLYEGEILVPLRVISEGLGAYVQWVAERHVVVVRYVELTALLPTPASRTPVPATPVPATPRPTLPSTPAPKPTPVTSRTPGPVPAPAVATPTPSPRVIAVRKARLIASIDYMNSPSVSNETTPAHTIANQSFGIQAAYEFGVPHMFLVQVDFKRYRFAHNALQVSTLCDPAPTGCTTVNGKGQYQTGVCPAPDPGCVTAVGSDLIAKLTGRAQEYVPAFNGEDTDVDLRAALRIIPHVYAGAGLYTKHYNYLGYPNIRGYGIGITKLPNLEKQLSLFASVWYYPRVVGKYTYPVSPYLGPFSGLSVPFGYSVVKYRAGATFWLNATSLFLEAGWAGEYFTSKINAPAGTWTEGSFFGIGTFFP